VATIQGVSGSAAVTVSTATSSLARPVLLTPAAGAELPQQGRRDPVTGGAICLTVTPAWEFSWAGNDPRYVRYHLRIQHLGSQFPLMDGLVSGTSFAYRGCGYVADSNRFDWQWQVYGLTGDGVSGPTSELRTFSVSPLGQ
jgi:hypothetical protein